MKGIITDIRETRSNTGRIFYYFFFKMEDGKSAKTCVDPRFGNSNRWLDLRKRYFQCKTKAEQLIIDGLNIRGRLVDADSLFKVSVDKGEEK